MNITVLNKSFNSLKLIDEYESLIWTDRYNEYGDFEIRTSITDSILKVAQKDYYLISSDSEHVMIIEDLKINSDSENGNELLITGRSLESILDRRIIWNQTNIRGSLQNGIRKLLNEAIISPTNSRRAISNFVFLASTDPAITSLRVDVQYTGDNLYDAISELCKRFGLGFSVTLNMNNEFVFSLYKGKDRTYNQNELPYVIFSPKFENIINSNYIESKRTLKTIALIAGEGEGSARITSTASTGSITGLNRREMFVDARDISRTVENEETHEQEEMPLAEYKTLLQERGAVELAEHKMTTAFEGQTETSTVFKYNEDFFMGDIVQIENEYGHMAESRISEMVTSDDSDGVLVYPTFELLQDDEYEGDT